MANNFHTILLESPLYDDLKTFSAQIENQTSLKKYELNKHYLMQCFEVNPKMQGGGLIHLQFF